MTVKEHFPRINEPLRVKGINFYDLLFLTIGIFILVIITAILALYLEFNGALPIVLEIGAYFFILKQLNKANKQDHPQYLLSLVSFKFFQPKKITYYNPLRPWRKASSKK